MRIPTIVVLLPVAALLVALAPVAASAQPLTLKTSPAPGPVPGDRVAPAVPDRDLYPQRPSLPQTPHFIGPLSRDSATGRAGVAGYTAANPAVGSRVAGDHDNPGWPSIGVVFEWGRSHRAN
ncbi:MAG TPA: hypothetical protein VFE48_12465 [Methylomirabilota bacterium]|nr:hypothetical protein [Methylomirabilota bacterium]